MKKLLLLILSLVLVLGSSTTGNGIESGSERISFRIKGTGKKGIFVTIGIGSKPGTGACCTGVSTMSTVGFTGSIGDVVYDGKTKRIITKIYKELEGTTLNLEDYY